MIIQHPSLLNNINTIVYFSTVTVMPKPALNTFPNLTEEEKLQVYISNSAAIGYIRGQMDCEYFFKMSFYTLV